MVALRIGTTAPDFAAATAAGGFRFHDWNGCCGTILVSHAKDVTSVGRTDLGYMAKIKPEFDERNGETIGIGADFFDRHTTRTADIATQGDAPNGAMIGDPELTVAKVYGRQGVTASTEGRSAADNQRVCTVFVVGPIRRSGARCN